MFEQPGFGRAKAFQVKYEGIWYRHETEVRWARFLGRLGVVPKYEPSGAKLTDGSAYRPDFYLKRLDAWLEVKSSKPPIDDFKRYAQFSRDSGRAVLLAIDSPSLNRNIWIVRPRDGNHWHGPYALLDWLPLDGLALASDCSLVIFPIGGGELRQKLLCSKPVQSLAMKALIEDARNLPLMPKDRLKLAS